MESECGSGSSWYADSDETDPIDHLTDEPLIKYVFIFIVSAPKNKCTAAKR